MSSGAGAAFTIAKKDILSQTRKQFEFFSMFLFALVSVLAFAFAVAGTVEPESASALVWVIIFLTGMFGFAPVFISESETGTLRGLSLAPIPAWSVFIGKVFYGFVLMGIVEIFLIPICMGLLGFSFNADFITIIIVFTLGTLDLAAVGAMASALTMPAESKSTIYPVVYFPTATSALILLIEMTRILVAGPGFIPIMTLIQTLCVHLIAMMTLSATVFHYTLSS